MKLYAKPLAIVSLTTLTMLSNHSAIASELSANVGFTNNYIWRGMQQTNGDAAISGGIDYMTDSGFYIGTWTSNASWAEDMTYELDVYGGYSAKINKELSYDVGYIYYAYPDEKTGDADFSEIYGSINYHGLNLGLAVLIDGEGASFGDTTYLSADYHFSVGNDADLGLHFGSYNGDWLDDDLINYGVSLNKDGFSLTFSTNDAPDNDLKVTVSYSMDIDL